ncbi:replicative DNA helicase [Asticcacaulis sp.]|uniref:replicative DNA helicase n=1 Tax=Asticcacaulis sp. TaxID=1872648 RepID=UPI003F7B75A0
MGEISHIPFNIEAEQALLGLFLYDPSLMAEAGGLRATDFYDGGHQLIYAALQGFQFRGEAITGPAIAAKLAGEANFQTLGGAPFLYTLADKAPAATMLAHYRGLVGDLSSRRELVRMADSLKAAAAGGDETAEGLIARAEAALVRVASGAGFTDSWVNVGALVDRVGDILSGRAAPQYITTGYDGLDEVMGGLRMGRMMVLAGRPSMGKSAVMTAMARRIAMRGIPVGVFSLEMDEDEVGLRMACDAAYDPDDPDSPVYYDAQRGKIHPDAARKLALGAQTLRGLPIEFDCRPGLRTSQIAMAAKRLIRKMEKAGYPKGVLIVDHLHIVAPEEEYRGNRVAEVGAMSHALAMLAKETGWALLVLAQLSREVDSRKNADKRPQMSDLRWAGEIEQDANTISFIYRPEKYLREPENKADLDAWQEYEIEKDRLRGVLMLLNEKNRGGPTGTEHEMRISLAHNALWERRAA